MGCSLTAAAGRQDVLLARLVAHVFDVANALANVRVPIEVAGFVGTATHRHEWLVTGHKHRIVVAALAQRNADLFARVALAHVGLAPGEGHGDDGADYPSKHGGRQPSFVPAHGLVEAPRRHTAGRAYGEVHFTDALETTIDRLVIPSVNAVARVIIPAASEDEGCLANSRSFRRASRAYAACDCAAKLPLLHFVRPWRGAHVHRRSNDDRQHSECAVDKHPRRYLNALSGDDFATLAASPSTVVELLTVARSALATSSRHHLPHSRRSYARGRRDARRVKNLSGLLSGHEGFFATNRLRTAAVRENRPVRSAGAGA